MVGQVTGRTNSVHNLRTDYHYNCKRKLKMTNAGCSECARGYVWWGPAQRVDPENDQVSHPARAAPRCTATALPCCTCACSRREARSAPCSCAPRAPPCPCCRAGACSACRSGGPAGRGAPRFQHRRSWHRHTWHLWFTCAQQRLPGPVRRLHDYMHTSAQHATA